MSNGGGTQMTHTLSAIGPENADAIERMTSDPGPYTRALAKNELSRLRPMPR